MEELVLFTGGTGTLGTEIQKIRPKNFIYPPHDKFDITDYESMFHTIRWSSPPITTIVHAAALISPPIVDKNPIRALDTNIIGTTNVTKLCIEHNIRLVYISTDYVFDGSKGSYTEEDSVLPVNNYAWSKLGGECAVQLHKNSLIIRTSFSPNQFPHPKAFVDQWTSREPVSNTARKIIQLAASYMCGIIHIGGIRQTVKDYAIMIGKNDVQDLHRNEVNFNAPKDTSLDCSKFNRIFK